jgi:hypothetical protein
MTVSVDHDLDYGVYRLMVADDRMRGAYPAGPRILKGEPHPRIQFSHATPEGANKNADVLRQYLSDLASGKLKKRNRDEEEPRRKGWWED